MSEVAGHDELPDEALGERPTLDPEQLRLPFRPEDNYSRIIGRAVVAGELRLEEAYEAIGNFIEWEQQDARKPRAED